MNITDIIYGVLKDMSLAEKIHVLLKEGPWWHCRNCDFKVHQKDLVKAGYSIKSATLLMNEGDLKK